MQSFNVNGVKFAFRFTPGNGAPVVLMHGWGCSSATLASIEKTAATLGRPVLNIDFPGFGESSEPQTVWDTFDYADAFAKLLQSQAIGPDAVLLGHSFGGRVAIIHAAKHPVGKLILVDAAGVKPRRSLSYYLKVYSFKAKKHILRAILGPKKAEQKLDALRAKAGSSDYRGASPRMRAIMSRVVNQDLCSLMPLIKAPTLLIWGENDTATPLADARKMERRIPQAALVSFPACGHYSFLDNPRQFAAVLTSFLNS